MNHLLAFALCLAAFLALAASTSRQQRTLFVEPLTPGAVIGLRFLSSCLLLFALTMLVQWQGWGLGLVMLSGHTSLAAGCVHLGLITRARKLRDIPED